MINGSFIIRDAGRLRFSGTRRYPHVFLKLESSVGENTRLFLNEAGAMAAKLLSTLKLQSQGCIDGLYFFWENVMEAEKIRVHRNRYLMVGLLARQSTKDFVILL